MGIETMKSKLEHATAAIRVVQEIQHEKLSALDDAIYDARAMDKSENLLMLQVAVRARLHSEAMS